MGRHSGGGLTVVEGVHDLRGVVGVVSLGESEMKASFYTLAETAPSHGGQKEQWAAASFPVKRMVGDVCHDPWRASRQIKGGSL